MTNENHRGGQRQPGPRGRHGKPPAAHRPSGQGRGPRGDRGGRTLRTGSGPRKPSPPSARRVALEVLKDVRRSDSYANLILPSRLSEAGITGRDAAFATELTYGTLRMQGKYDAIVTVASGREANDIDADILDILRLGAHQIIAMRVPSHAAVSEQVNLANTTANRGAAGFVNAILRRVSERDAEEWVTALAEASTGDDVEDLARITSHPSWIVRAFRQALTLDARDPASELPTLLHANNTPPRVHLVARPGLTTTADLANQANQQDAQAEPLPIPTAVELDGSDPGELTSVRSGHAAVQDAGSQLVALALAAADVEGNDTAWADLCAGPGGKATLLAALAAPRGGHVTAVEIAPHRARLVEQSARQLSDHISVRTDDGRHIGEDYPQHFARVLVDAPCTGLGALRRRPEARWRRTASDLTTLSPLQRQLLDSAIAATRPGGLVMYATCSPHAAETRTVVEDALRRHRHVSLEDTATHVAAISDELDIQGTPLMPRSAARTGTVVQLWPHEHGTDAMFMALLRVGAPGQARD